MKTAYIFVLFALLVTSVICEDTDTKTSVDVPDNTVPASDSNNEQTEEVSDDKQENDDDNDDQQDNDGEQGEGELQDALVTEDVNVKTTDDDEKSNKQSIGITLKPGRRIVITLSPDGGRGGGYHGNGVTYTRWGKTRCPGRARKIYDGYAAGGWYSQKGNGANYLCMHKRAQYISSTRLHAPSYLYGAEYETTGGLLRRVHDYNVPCVVCQSPRINKLVVPGRVRCPRSWTREYYGYLMTSHYNHWRSAVYECVDHNPQGIPGTRRNRDGALFYFTTAVCSYGLPCGPYTNNRAVTCAVCTK